ncbi:aldolase/citrate lyase family protein [Actibacterium sp. 188UL27-1]|uniref:aldolase/citrate lyase family protein n=1 Tax=Actibacterium sp. 188UL27-1 TaxID=2786961 RepID=UPI00195850E3|nr:aldolase/citrate lyase family protein [Actibacterium sp. 188UL27-1]MBM7066458.1 hypothetical protein [Actibacterium sp. 188UL27-1]
MKKFPELFLFTSDDAIASQAISAGVDGIVIDWEHVGKSDRQLNYDTEINADTVEDVARLHATVPTANILVRIEAAPGIMEDQVEAAIGAGAATLMLPMARSARDVEVFLNAVNGRAKSVIQIETQDLFERCGDLKDLEWDYAYIGLNDLAISRGREWLFEAFVDGTVDDIFETLPERKIGLGGLTVVSGGAPLPFPKLFSEMARLGCAMTFMRRSFHREIVGRDLKSELDAARSLWHAFDQRGPEAVAHDHRLFIEAVEGHAVSIGLKTA